MKFVLLVTICVLGTVLGETHDQQKKFANVLVADIEEAADLTKDMLKNYDESTAEARKLILIHANSFNFNLHYILDCLQYLVIRNKRQPMILQDIVLKLNDIAYDLEESFKYAVRVVKSQLQKSVEDVVVEAKNIRKIIRENDDHVYRTTVLRYLDVLTTATQGAVTRNEIRRQPKDVAKSLVRTAEKILTSTLDSINSSNPNVQEDIVRYSSKLSSAISETKSVLRDLAFTYKTKKEDEVKEIIYFLSKIVRENDEVIYNESTFQKIKDQFRVSFVNLAEQMNKMIDAGYSDDQTMEDENLIYVVFSNMLNLANEFHRDLVKTIDNNIRRSINE